MPRHDQLFKDLFRAFFPDLIALVAPEAVEHLVLDERTFLDKELSSRPPWFSGVQAGQLNLFPASV